jgi:hypothetical protein
VNTPKVAAADFAIETRTLSSNDDILRRLLKISVPKSMRRRRVYAMLCAEDDVNFGIHWAPANTGRLNFRLDGSLVHSIPFNRYENIYLNAPAGRIGLRPGAEGLTDPAGGPAYASSQPGERDSLMVSIGQSQIPQNRQIELVLPPQRVELTCDSIELEINAVQLVGNPDGDKALLACHSEGEYDA